MRTGPAEDSVLKLIYDGCDEDAITDEQVWRVLEPVRDMILQGRFRKPGFSARVVRPALAAAAAVAITAFAAYWPPAEIVAIAEEPIPLAAAPAEARSCTGRVLLEEKGLAGLRLRVADQTGARLLGETTTAEDGAFSFGGLPDIPLVLEAELPEGMETERLVYSLDSKDSWEGVDINICRAN